MHLFTSRHSFDSEKVMSGSSRIGIRFLTQLSPFVLGLVLATAGFMKAIQPYDRSTDALFQFPISLFEIWLSVLCMFAGMDRRIRVMLLAFFSVGLIYNLRLAVMGINDCGCFGPLSLKPIHTIAIDAVCLTMAWLSTSEDTVLTRPSLVAIFVAIAIVGPLNFVKFRDINITIRKMSVQCDLESGKPFQFASHIVGGSEFMKGKWKLLFFRSNCPDCVAALEELNSSRDSDKQMQIAVVEIPPLGNNPIQSIRARYSYLDPQIEWEISTPMRIGLSDGLVSEIECPLRLR